MRDKKHIVKLSMLNRVLGLENGSYFKFDLQFYSGTNTIIFKVKFSLVSQSLLSFYNYADSNKNACTC